MSNDYTIKEGQLDDPRVIQLLQVHLSKCSVAHGSSHALNLCGLKSDDIKFFTMWDKEALLGKGALKTITSTLCEIKSMHTAEASRGKGIASLLVKHLIETARSLGMERISLETGSSEFFHPARELYRKLGFVECPPFGEYLLDPNSTYMTFVL
jgi:putative acetyltransferase